MQWVDKHPQQLHSAAHGHSSSSPQLVQPAASTGGSLRAAVASWRRQLWEDEGWSQAAARSLETA